MDIQVGSLVKARVGTMYANHCGPVGRVKSIDERRGTASVSWSEHDTTLGYGMTLDGLMLAEKFETDQEYEARAMKEIATALGHGQASSEASSSPCASCGATESCRHLRR